MKILPITLNTLFRRRKVAFRRDLSADHGQLPERALQRRGEEPHPLHAAAARRRDDGRPHPEKLQNHQLDQPAGMN